MLCLGTDGPPSWHADTQAMSQVIRGTDHLSTGRDFTMQGLWDGFEGRGFAAWLPSFYDAVLNAASSEARWCATALPDSHPQMLLQLLHALFSRIDKAFRTRLASALVQGLPLNLAPSLRRQQGCTEKGRRHRASYGYCVKCGRA